MTSAAPWGAIPQSEGLANAAGDLLEEVGRGQQDELVDSASGESSSVEFDKERADYEVTKLARRVTQHSIKSTRGSYSNPFGGSDDPALDPNSGYFKPEIWVRTLMG